MKKGGGSESTIIVGPSKSVLVYALHSLEYVLGLARFRVFVAKLYYIIIIISFVDGQTDRQIDRHTDGQTHGQTDGQTDGLG